MTAVVRAEDVYPRYGVRVSTFEFRCPYCDRRFERGGHKEGFVKSGASNHVFTCWTVGLFLRGYMLGHAPIRGGQRAIRVETIEKKTRAGEIHPNYLRAIKAAVAKRRRDGVLATLAPCGVA